MVGDRVGLNGMFFVNLSNQIHHWPLVTFKVYMVTSFALELQKGDFMISWDIQSGYYHFYPYPEIIYLFLFRHVGRYHRFISLPFGCSRSALWFTNLLRPLLCHLHERISYHVLHYINDFFMSPPPPHLVAWRPRSITICLEFVLLGFSSDLGWFLIGERDFERVLDSLTISVFTSTQRP